MFRVNESSIDDAIHIETIMTSVTRYFLVLLNVIILFVSIAGNAIVLYGSTIHNALRMDKVTLLLVKNVAAADILVAVLFYLPALVNLLHGRWLLGYGMCFINGWMSLIPTVAEIVTLTVLSCYRLALIVGKVKRSIRHNLKPWYIVIGSVWGGLTLLPFIFSALEFLPYYDPYTQSCNSADLANSEEPLYKVVFIAMLNVILNIIPMLIITTANIFILISIYKASSKMDNKITTIRGSIKLPEPPKKHSRLPTRTIKAIPMICLTFIFSYFPYLIACLSNMGVVLPHWWRTLTFYFSSINIMSNPLIYAAVNLEFRKYIMTLVGLAELSSNDTAMNACKDISSSTNKSGMVPETCHAGERSLVSTDNTAADQQ